MKIRFFLSLLICVCCFAACGDNNGGGTTPEPSNPDNLVNGHEYVDMGLSVKWAACNVGAATPSDFGSFFSWGGTDRVLDYTTGNCATYNKAMSDIAGNATYDAARAQWGDKWRMPTTAEIDELISNCAMTWIVQDGIPGCLFISTNTGQRIFLPAGGFRREANVYKSGIEAYYWSSTPLDGDNKKSYALFFVDDFPQHITEERNLGYSIRPVIEL